MPPVLTAGSGMDAIAHAVETFCSPRWNPPADALAMDGLVRAFHHIRPATADGNNLESRRQMLLGSLEAALAFQKGLGAVHSLSHPLGALPGHSLHHGMLNGLFLPHVLRFNMDACRERLAAIADRLGFDHPHDLPDAFAELIQNLGLACNLRDMGVSQDELTGLWARAAADHCTQTNPRPMGEPEFAELYQAAW